MSCVLYFSALIINLFLAFAKKQSKILCYFTLIVIILIMGYNASTSDNVNYIVHYNNIKYGIYTSNKSEFGFIWLMGIGNKLGLDWLQFKLVIASICVPVMYSTVKLYSKNVHFVYFFYLLHTFYMDAEQFRNFIALTIFVYSIRFLVRGNKKDKFVYLLFVLLASTIHNSFLFYIPLLFVNIKNKNKLIKFVVILSLLLCLITFFNDNKIPFINILFENMESGNAKMYKYINQKTNLGFLIPFCLHIINFISIYISRKYFMGNNLNSFKEKQMKYVDTIYWINIFIFTLFPLFMTSVTFYRLTRNFNILNFIVISICSNTVINKKEKLYINLILCCNVLIWFVFDLLIRADEVLIPILQGNIFFK